jgi:hypothetical protein
MKAIFLYGNRLAVTAAYRHVDAMLRKRPQLQDIVIAMVASVDEETAQSLRHAGGELWHCGPTGSSEADLGGITPDRCLHAASWYELTGQAVAAMESFIGGLGAPA